MSDKQTLKCWEVEIMEAVMLDHGEHGPCQRCNEWSILIECDSRRMDSKALYNLCPYCAAEHHEFWDEQWAEYYRGLL